jgi:hypothetical protein
VRDSCVVAPRSPSLAGERGVERGGHLDGVGVAQVDHVDVAAGARAVEAVTSWRTAASGWACRRAPAGCCCCGSATICGGAMPPVFWPPGRLLGEQA